MVVFDRFGTKGIAIKCLEDRGAEFYQNAIDSLYSSILDPELDTTNMTLDTIMSEKDHLKPAYQKLMPQLAEQRDTSKNCTLFEAYVRSVESLFTFSKSTSNPKKRCVGDWLVSNLLEDIVDIYNLSRFKNKNDRNGACILGYDGTLAMNNPLFNQKAFGLSDPSDSTKDNLLMKKMINGTFSLSMMFKPLHEQVRNRSPSFFSPTIQ